VEPTGEAIFVQINPGGVIVVMGLARGVRTSFDQDRINLFDDKTQLALHGNQSAVRLRFSADAKDLRDPLTKT